MMPDEALHGFCKPPPQHWFRIRLARIDWDKLYPERQGRQRSLTDEQFLEWINDAWGIEHRITGAYSWDPLFRINDPAKYSLFLLKYT